MAEFLPVRRTRILRRHLQRFVENLSLVCFDRTNVTTTPFQKTTTTSASAIMPTSALQTLTNTASTLPLSLSTSTRTSSVSDPTSSESRYNCPLDEKRNYTSALLANETWTILCDINWPHGENAIGGGIVWDLTAVLASSIDSCIDQCVAWTFANEATCKAVTYGANRTLVLSRGEVSGACFLKTQRASHDTIERGGQLESAYLVT